MKLESTNKEDFKKLNCSPSRNDDIDDNNGNNGDNDNNENKFTCYKSDELLKIKEKWNKRHPDEKINSNDVKEIWATLKNNMQNVCNNEACWLRQEFMEKNINNELLNYTFAPKAPKTWLKNPNEWLSSVDISKVMKQYEYTYPSFNFIGPSPIDFDTITNNTSGGVKDGKSESICVWNELCNFSLKNHLEKGKKKIGIIFNTDPHYKNGSHWISLFINIEPNNNYIFFFDSNGNAPPSEIKKFYKRIIKEAKDDLGMDDLMYYENKRSHQQGNTECGMYSLYLIIELLLASNNQYQNNKIDYFMNTWIPDETVEGLREKYFNIF